MFVSEESLQNKEYMLDLCIRMAHHSTAIEGNTLSQDETASIILDNFIASPVKEREFYEVRNYKILLPYFIEKLHQKIKIDAELIKFFHSLIMKDLHEQAGNFKILQNAIIGSDFETAKPYLVPVLLKELCDNLYFRLENSKSKEEKIEAIFESHIDFEKIHPFSDGNGRTGRLLMVYSCFEANTMPIVIPKDKKDFYISYLRKAKVDEDCINFVNKLQAQEKERYLKFKQAQMQNHKNKKKQR